MQNREKLLTEAKRCLNCRNPQCRTGCPISTDIPGFISKTKEENFEEAYKILQKNNIFSEICSIVCPTERQCMGKCIRGIKEEPVKINFLEKSINEWANENNIKYDIEKTENANTKIAIVGSGPAGLACAADLIKNGFDVTVFEKEASLGGVLEYGIPGVRLDKKLVNKVVEKLISIGLKVEYNVEFGKDILLDDLYKQNYKSVFLAMGTQEAKTYMLSEEKCDKIYKANDFLNLYNKGKKFENLGKTIIIGGGNVAIDTAIAALELQTTDVIITYRKDKEIMPAGKNEIKEVEKLGVKILTNTKVISSQIKNNKIDSITCIKTKLENGENVEIQGSEFTISADTIIFAIGLKIDEKLVKELDIETENNLIKVDENYMTNIKGIFAGGDLIEKKSTVAKAIATGKKAALGIINYCHNGKEEENV